MINHISISNFAIIENTEVDFEEGLNIVTGETGSGKSIVIEAISLALGSRADSSYVRHGADKAVIQLSGELDDEEIVIIREISAAGKNLCRLNGRLVTLGELNDTRWRTFTASTITSPCSIRKITSGLWTAFGQKLSSLCAPLSTRLSAGIRRSEAS